MTTTDITLAPTPTDLDLNRRVEHYLLGFAAGFGQSRPASSPCTVEFEQGSLEGLNARMAMRREIEERYREENP